MTADIDVLKEGMEGLIRAGYYKNREALLEDAFRTMIEVKPSVKMEMAAELYKSKKISLSRAAEIAGTSLEGFKAFLELKGIKRIVSAPSEERLQKGVDFLIGYHGEKL
jgi:predicted HTH domain antitoxin